MSDHQIQDKKGSSAAKIVADKLLEMAVKRGLKTGDKLPGEVELAAEFKVSRITVREAINGLKFLGILDSAPRRGTTIAGLDYSSLSKYLGFQMAFSPMGEHELLESRIAIESGLMNLVAAKMTQESYRELVTLATACEIESNGAEDIHKSLIADLNFHRKLLEIAGNQIIMAFGNLIETFFLIHVAQHPGNSIDSKSAAEMHLLIVNALHEKNIDLARGLIRRHLMRHIENPAAELVGSRA